MPEIRGKLTFRPNLHYHGLDEKFLASRRGTFEGLNSGKEFPKTIFYWGGQGCRIISVEKTY